MIRRLGRKFIGCMAIVLFITALGFPIKPITIDGEGIARTPSGIPYTQLEQEIDNYVNTYIGISSPGTAIVVTKGKEMIFSKGYGYSNIENRTPVDPSRTVFDYGSINKLFVWTSVMKLVEEGKMKLDQDIRTYFPEEFADKLRYDKPITMLDIMSHTAGFEQHPLALFIKSPKKLESLEETLLSVQPEQIYEPGKVIAYSNYATSMAAFAVEMVSGESFSDFEMNRILRPLGMHHTTGHPKMADHLDLNETVATGYEVVPNGDILPRESYYVPLYPAGAMKGTAEDLARFAMALTTGDSRLFSKQQTLRTMLSQSYAPHDNILSNAHGFWEYRTHPRAIGHSGNTMGFSSEFAIVPDEQLGVVVLTNAEIEQHITTGVLDLLLGDKETLMIPSISPLMQSSEVAGHYVLSGNTYSTLQEFMSYLGIIKLEAKGEYNLVLTAMGMTGEYKQIRPHLYKLETTDSEMIQKIAPTLYAEVTNGKVTRLSKGIAVDLLPVKLSRSVPFLIAYAIAALTAVLFFLVTPIWLLVRYYLQKRRGTRASSTANRLFAAFVVCGTAMVLNVLFLMLNVLMYQHETPGLLNLGIILNWIFAIFSVLLLATSILKNKSDTLSRGQKLFRVVTVMIQFSFVAVLIEWNFFHLIT